MLLLPLTVGYRDRLAAVATVPPTDRHCSGTDLSSSLPSLVTGISIVLAVRRDVRAVAHVPGSGGIDHSAADGLDEILGKAGRLQLEALAAPQHQLHHTRDDTRVVVVERRRLLHARVLAALEQRRG